MEGKQLQIAAVVIAIGTFFAGLGTGFAAFGNQDGSTKTVLALRGSTTVEPIASLWATEYMERYPNMDIQVTGTGSGNGIETGKLNLTDIGMSSKDPEPYINRANVTEMYTRIYPCAFDGIAMIVQGGSSYAPADLSLDDLANIYNGTYTDWGNVSGGQGGVPIVPYGRTSDSGTYETFWKKVLTGEAEYNDTAVQARTGNEAVQSAVASTSGSIGYVGLSFAAPASVDAVTIEGIEANKTSVQDGTYPIARKLFLLTGGKPTGKVQDFLLFAISPDAQAIIEDAGFVPLSDVLANESYYMIWRESFTGP
ncbi:phosphate ABC transporter substrate-binding protein [Candidatus Bathyarchaeota archaeon]|nr:phosphate ABC transporter substrate-binding protein [Candidatus Bathyarchaeota archaeon]